jgi:hypothetical protein
MVLCLVEMSPIQALERSLPLRPLGLGYLEAVTRDNIGYCTATVIAALDLATGEVRTPSADRAVDGRSVCHPGHRCSIHARQRVEQVYTIHSRWSTFGSKNLLN